MGKAIKDLFGSKKFLLTLLGSAVYLVLIQLGVPEPQALSVLGLFGLGVAGQAVADHGKEAGKEERKILEGKTAGLPPAERAAALEAAALGDIDE